MPTIKEILKAKALRLQSVPNDFYSKITRVQNSILPQIEDMLTIFDIGADGRFIVSERNMALAAELDVMLRQVLSSSEYADAVTAFAKEFNVQIGVNDAYFKETFKGFTTSEIGAMTVRQAQSNAVQLLINTSPDVAFVMPIKQQIETAVINGARFRDTINILQEIVTGNDEVDGKILHYSKQIAHDAFAVADRSYSSAVAEQYDAEWFLWSGGEIKTTRPFCAERHDRYFHYKEIELWGKGVDTLEPKTIEEGTWKGQMEGTNEFTIFSTAGGYNCRHSVMAVSVFSVPIEQVQRAIENGWYEPDDFEKEQLGI
jgi:hypothetical protein